MPIRLVWRQQAEDHLQTIFDFVSADNPRTAKAYAEAIVGAFDRLRNFPHSGRRYDDRYRVLMVRNHLVFYRHDPGTSSVDIVAIIDGRRDVTSVLDEIGGTED